MCFFLKKPNSLRSTHLAHRWPTHRCHPRCTPEGADTEIPARVQLALRPRFRACPQPAARSTGTGTPSGLAPDRSASHTLVTRGPPPRPPAYAGRPSATEPATAHPCCRRPPPGGLAATAAAWESCSRPEGRSQRGATPPGPSRPILVPLTRRRSTSSFVRLRLTGTRTPRATPRLVMSAPPLCDAPTNRELALAPPSYQRGGAGPATDASGCSDAEAEDSRLSVGWSLSCGVGVWQRRTRSEQCGTAGSRRGASY